MTGSEPCGVVFDKDGTLLDFAKTWNPAFLALLHETATATAGGVPDPERLRGVAGAVGYDLENETVLRGSPLIAGNNDEIAELLVPWAANEEALLRGYVAAKDVTMRSMEPMAHATEVLAELQSRGVRLAIATNDTAEGAERMIDAFGWQGVFDAVVGFRSGYGSKPQPGMVLGALSEIGVAPANAIMIGDSTHDIDAGEAAGTATVLIGDAECHQVDHRIADLRELLPIVAATFS